MSNFYSENFYSKICHRTVFFRNCCIKNVDQYSPIRLRLGQFGDHSSTSESYYLQKAHYYGFKQRKKVSACPKCFLIKISCSVSSNNLHISFNGDALILLFFIFRQSLYARCILNRYIKLFLVNSYCTTKQKNRKTSKFYNFAQIGRFSENN